MQCDVTTNVADAITNVGNPNESSETLSNYRGGTTASARVRYKLLSFGEIISGAVEEKYMPKKSGTLVVRVWVRTWT